MLRLSEITASYAARTSGVYSRFETPDELMAPEHIVPKAIANVSMLVERGFGYDEIADLVETQTNHPSAVAALGFVLMLYRMAGGQPFRKSRRAIRTCTHTSAIIQRLAMRCDIIWSKIV